MCVRVGECVHLTDTEVKVEKANALTQISTTRQANHPGSGYGTLLLDITIISIRFIDETEDCIKMNLPSAIALALTLIPVSAAHVISFPVSQANRVAWNPSGVVRQSWKAGLQTMPQSTRPKKQSLPKRSKPSVQLLPRPELPPKDFQRPIDNSFLTNITRDLKLTNYYDKVYYCSIALGTPGQKFNMAIFTNSPAMWVPSVHHTNDNALSHPHQRFDNAYSVTHRAMGKMFTAFHEDRLVGGYWSQDTLSVAGMRVKNQAFGAAIVDSDIFEDTIIDGVLGLRPRDVGEGVGPNVFENMMMRKLLPAPVFSLFLNRFNSDDPDSTLTLGGTNPDHYSGKFVYTPLTEPNRWRFKVEGIQIANHDEVICSTGFQAELDSGTPLIQGPLQEVDDLHSMLGAKPHRDWPRRYSFDCSEVDSLPDVGFIVNGKILPLSSKDYVIKEYKDGQLTCYSAIQELLSTKNESPVWVIGNTYDLVFIGRSPREGVGGIVDNESALRCAGSLLSRVQAPPPASGLTEGLKV
ncbi:cathepsin d [Plakobranchus ocellatus]|uniref:Cathepsin d n=1 Tax=Plakobranchus ocellatus TaxID=259542 RepID=A0AAV4A692_9GAST|nr:cathepsin d [Plakobranchus ocellatus]